MSIPIKISLGQSGTATSNVINIPKAIHDYRQTVLHLWFLKKGEVAPRGYLAVSGASCQDWASM